MISRQKMRILCPYGRPVGLFCEVMDILALKAVISKSSFFFFSRSDHHTFPPSLRLPLLPRDGRISKVCLWFWTQSSIPVVLYIPPPVPDFVFMKGGISNVLCRRSSCHCDHAILSEVQQREGSFFSLYFPLTGVSVHFCVLTHPWFPPPLGLWV